MAQASKVSLAPGGSSEGRLGRQVARRKVVLGARRFESLLYLFFVQEYVLNYCVFGFFLAFLGV